MLFVFLPSHRLVVRVRACDVDDSDGLSVQVKSMSIDHDRHTKAVPRLASCALQESVDVIDADNVDTTLLRHAHQDYSPFGHVREGTHGRSHLCRRILGECLRLNRSGITTTQLKHSQSAQQTLKIVDHSFNSIS